MHWPIFKSYNKRIIQSNSLISVPIISSAETFLYAISDKYVGIIFRFWMYALMYAVYDGLKCPQSIKNGKRNVFYYWRKFYLREIFWMSFSIGKMYTLKPFFLWVPELLKFKLHMQIKPSNLRILLMNYNFTFVQLPVFVEVWWSISMLIIFPSFGIMDWSLYPFYTKGRQLTRNQCQFI